MSTDRRSWLRWAAPAAVVAVVGAGAVAASGSATADPSLPARTPAQLLVDVQQARLVPLLGTIVQSSDLGLPDLRLPGAGGRGSGDLQSAITGTHTWRVWYAAPERARVALLGSSGESDVIRNGRDVWVWSSAGKSATHYVLPDPAARPTSTPGAVPAVPPVPPMPVPPGLLPGGPTAGPLPRTPQEAADRALAALDPSTEVTAPGTTTVAGRAAYQLVLTPRDRESLVASVQLAVDAETKVPLRVQVMSTRIDTPAFEIGFTSVDFAVPEEHLFTFTPPPGTTVTERGHDTPEGAPRPGVPPTPGSPELPAPPTPPAPPRVVGTGWTSVVVAPLPSEPPSLPGASTPTGSPAPTGGSLERMLDALPRVSGAWGSGRVLAGTLFTVVLTDDGRVAGGAVGQERVLAALAGS